MTALQHFAGFGAAQLLRGEQKGLLIEYVDEYDLTRVPEDESLEIFAEVVARLHHPRGIHPKGLSNMRENFESLFHKAKTEPADSIFHAAAEMADGLLKSAGQPQALHGDLHHGNVLHSSRRGWMAIDPKGVIGEQAYDIVSFFYNPKELSAEEITTRLETRSLVLSDYLNIDWTKILQYAFVFGCLSACWSLEDGEDPGRTLQIAKAAYDLLRRS